MGIGVLDLFFAVCCIFYLPKTPLFKIIDKGLGAL
jgi:hypothetical protein